MRDFYGMEPHILLWAKCLSRTFSLMIRSITGVRLGFLAIMALQIGYPQFSIYRQPLLVITQTGYSIVVVSNNCRIAATALDVPNYYFWPSITMAAVYFAILLIEETFITSAFYCWSLCWAVSFIWELIMAHFYLFFVVGFIWAKLDRNNFFRRLPGVLESLSATLLCYLCWL